MWCVIYTDKNDNVLHVICCKSKPTNEELQYMKKELKEDPEFNGIYNKIEQCYLEKVDMDYNQCVKEMEKIYVNSRYAK